MYLYLVRFCLADVINYENVALNFLFNVHWEINCFLYRSVLYYSPFGPEPTNLENKGNVAMQIMFSHPDVYPNNLKNWFLTSSALPQNFCPHSCLAS
jgi:hypothetical protein